MNLDKGSDTGDISSKDKKLTRERERDGGSQTDEELVGEAEFAHRVGAPLNMMRVEEKIDKLSALLPEMGGLKGRVVALESEND